MTGRSRRSCLVAGAALAVPALGGCTGPVAVPASLAMTATDDGDVARRVSADVDWSGPRGQLVRRIVENGSAVVHESVSGGTTVDEPYPHFPADEPFVRGGIVYALQYTVSNPRPARIFQVTLGEIAEPGDGTDDSASAPLHVDDLHPVDHRKLAARGQLVTPELPYSDAIVYLDPEVDQSVIVPDPPSDALTWPDGSTAALAVEGPAEVTVQTVRYTPTVVEPSAAAYGRTVRAEYAFALRGLSADEREIVETAIAEDGGWRITGDREVPAAFTRLADRFDGHVEVRGPGEPTTTASSDPTGEYLVRYEGSLYWVELWLADDGTTSTST